MTKGEETDDADGLDDFTKALKTASAAAKAATEVVGSGALKGPLLDTIAEAQAVLERLRAGLKATGANEDATALIFDVSDLLAYFPHNRLPTGIQRVQIEIISAFLTESEAVSVQLCCILDEQGVWAHVPENLFLKVCTASKANGNAQAADWLALVADLHLAIQHAASLQIPQNSILVNLGTSWWLPDYFMHIRRLKATHNIKYIPLIYDMIPALMPNYCNIELVYEFINWLNGVIRHADHYLAISEATKSDLIALADRIGLTVSPDNVAVLPLNADFRSDASLGSGSGANMLPVSGPFVLFVSTIEARKNQLGAIDAWQTLISTQGADRTPQLVLVGKLGFGGLDVEHRIQQSPDLRSKVTVLSQVGDGLLGELYRNCVFTIYPSFYEGWGLPVTESLSYGKVPLVARNSSLPEAGEDYAEYYESGSPSALVAGLLKLLHDAPYRSALEKRISTDFRPRQWRDVAAQLAESISAWPGRTDRAVATEIVKANAFFPMRRLQTSEIWKGMNSSERFRISGWWNLEDWGCWSRPEGGRLQLEFDGPRPTRIAFLLRGLPDQATRFDIFSEGHGAHAVGRIGAHQDRWAFLDLSPQNASRSIEILIQTSRETGRSVVVTVGGADKRSLAVGLVGFFAFNHLEEGERLAFIESAILGSLEDTNVYRRRS